MTRIQVFTIIVTLGVVTAPAAGELRTLSAEIDGAGLNTVNLEAAVGDISITTGTGPMITASVELQSRRGGFFSSLKTAEKQVRGARFEPAINGDTLRLEITGVEGDRRFNEEWTLTLPQHLAISLELGVGDVEISNTGTDLDLEIGVGDVTLRLNGGSAEIQVGVGDVTIRGPVAAYRSIETGAGVGDVRIIANGKKMVGEGFIAHSAEWQGGGDAVINAETGVGDVKIVLD